MINYRCTVMKKYWLMCVVVAVMSACSADREVSHTVHNLNKVMVNKDASYQKSLDFLGRNGTTVTEFFPKVLISMPADNIFKPDTAILYPGSMEVIKSLAVLISKYEHHAIDVTASVVAKKQSYIDYAISHNQGEKIIELLTEYGGYSFIGFNTQVIIEEEIFNSYYASGKYFIDIELS